MTLTPEQFNLLVTKEDLKNELKNFATKEDFNQMMNVLDHIAKKFEDHDEDHVVNIAAHDRMEGKLGDHETRLKLLEA